MFTSGPRNAIAATPGGTVLDLDLHPDLETGQALRERGAEAGLAHAPPFVLGHLRRAEVDDELALRFQQQRVRALADRHGLEVLREETLQERRGVGPGNDHEVTVEAGENW